MNHIFTLDNLAKHWADSNQNPVEIRETSIQRFKVTAFNVATTALITTVALTIIFACNLHMLLGCWLVASIRQSIARACQPKFGENEYWKPSFQVLDFIVHKEFTPPAVDSPEQVDSPPVEVQSPASSEDDEAWVN